MLGALSLGGSFSTGGGAGATSMAQLGLDDYEAAPGLKGQFGLLGGVFSLAGFQSEYAGSGTTEGAIEVRNQTIDAGTEVDSKLDLTVARALFSWNLLPIGPVEVGIGFGAELVDLELELQEQVSGDRLTSDELLTIPFAAVRAAWAWGPVAMRAVLAGTSYTYDGDETQLLDGDVEASVEVFDQGSLAVGYRLIDLDAEYDDRGDTIAAELELNGWYFGLRFSL